MLSEFLTSHRAELIRHCRQRMSKRFASAQVPSIVEHGVPLFLDQLVHILEAERLTTARPEHEPKASPVDSDIGRDATLHGEELLRLGYSVDQVVHHYGDVCQSVTALAVKKNKVVTTDRIPHAQSVSRRSRCGCGGFLRGRARGRTPRPIYGPASTSGQVGGRAETIGGHRPADVCGDSDRQRRTRRRHWHGAR